MDNNKEVCLISMALKIRCCTIKNFHCEQIILSLYMQVKLYWFHADFPSVLIICTRESLHILRVRLGT